jgi:hypothetical protein
MAEKALSTPRGTNVSPSGAISALVDAIDDDAGLTDQEVLAELHAAGIDPKGAAHKLDDALRRVASTDQR